MKAIYSLVVTCHPPLQRLDRLQKDLSGCGEIMHALLSVLVLLG